MQRSIDAVNRPPALAPVHDSDGLYSEHAARYERSPRFQAAWEHALIANRGIDPGISWRTHIGLWAASAASRVEGDFVECGVNAGFLSSAVLAYLEWNTLGKRFFLVDTFDGPPIEQLSDAEVENGAYAKIVQSIVAGAYVTDLEAVRRNYAGWTGVEIVQGVVPDVLGAVAAERVAFLHLDMNCAYPEIEALRFFWPRVSRGGMVLLDDYARKDYEALGDAFDTTAAQLGAEVLSLPTGQGLIVK
jgi:hypothetical protein